MVDLNTQSFLGGPQSDSSDVQVFLRSLAIVGIAELFDKTWFMGLLLAMKYPIPIVFTGSFAALFLHTILAAAFGLAFARFLQPVVLNFMAASIFILFAILYAKDWYMTDPEADAIAAGKAEAEEDCELDTPEHSGHELVSTNSSEENPSEESKSNNPVDAVESCKNKGGQAQASGIYCSVFSKSFMGVFIAEWGDRTQIAMVGQHASQPLIPVFLGSVVAFFLLTGSAVGLASMANDLKLSERLVYGTSAIFFAVFAALALKDAFAAMESEGRHDGHVMSG